RSHGPTYARHSPTRRSSDLDRSRLQPQVPLAESTLNAVPCDSRPQGLNAHQASRKIPTVNSFFHNRLFFPLPPVGNQGFVYRFRSEEHTSELQSRVNIVCRL